jgi:hypothetical protein
LLLHLLIIGEQDFHFGSFGLRVQLHYLVIFNILASRPISSRGLFLIQVAPALTPTVSSSPAPVPV